MIGLLLSVWADRVAKYVRDVAAPCGFARSWWEVRLRGAVPLGSAQPGFVRTRFFRSVRRSSSASASSSSSRSMLCTSVLRPARKIIALAATSGRSGSATTPTPLYNEEASTLLGKGTAMQGTRREDHIRPNIVNVEKVPISSAMPQRSRFRRLLRRLPTRMQL